MNEPQMPNHRLETLDALRLFAALAVVLFHFGFRGLTLEVTDVALPAYEAVLKYGYLGVQLFFVISGFVIAYSAEGRTPIQFGIARFSRIYPTFALCMTITFIVILALGSPRIHATMYQWLANFLIMPELVKQESLDGSYWSIFYEVVFYGWIFIFMSVGLFKRANYPVIVVAWLTVSVIDRTFIHSGILRYLVLTDQSAFFCAGLVLYAAFKDGYTKKNLLLLGLSALVAIQQSLILSGWNRNNYHVEYSDIVVAIACLSIIAIVAAAIKFPRTPLPSGVMLAIGGLTYPLYLLHQQIGYVLFNVFENMASPLVLVIAVTFALMIVSFLLWRYFELHAQRWTKVTLSRMLEGLEALRPRTVTHQREKIAG